MIYRSLRLISFSLLCYLLSALCSGKQGEAISDLAAHKIVKREKAFDLARIEAALEAQEDAERAQLEARNIHSLSSRDEALQDDRCQNKCNENLRSGLDMVKAHTSFGSIGVPSVIDETDLSMFCRLDAQHDQCLRDCGFSIQFNMRDYVCKDNFDLMLTNIPCYVFAAPVLKRQCGPTVCGPYADLEATVIGFANRCRTLICDLSCTEKVLLNRCGPVAGEQAARFLHDYSRQQVSTWIGDLANSMGKPVKQVIPRSCSRIFCDNYDTRSANCTAMAR
ncbi:hypothetical protein L596_001447 [Steinernema carpocapsae]|uniref:Chondroitin proteoglycan 4 domain-containing protein n=1 Tax=Steinernema carpocapsae TaxID=34508 RepID=A0A4U8ULL2_STECR|nr:hypothetical protein L596_001447 [Steinernema carpocapsae]